jgi:hypothetical protein
MTDTFNHWQALIADSRKNTVLIGPGAGVHALFPVKILKNNLFEFDLYQNLIFVNVRK